MPLISVGRRDAALHLRWTVPVPATVAWDVLTAPEQLKSWLGTLVAGSICPASSFTVDHGDGYHCRSMVLEFAQSRTLRYTWEFPNEPTSEVTWTLEPEQRGTTLTLVHEKLGRLAPSYRDGWLTHLTFLEAAALGSALPRTMFWNLHSTFACLTRSGDPTGSAERGVADTDWP